MITRVSPYVDLFIYDIDEAIATYKKLFGWEPAYRWDMPDIGGSIAYLPIGPCPGGFAALGGALDLEAPLGPNPHPIFDHVLKKRGEGFSLIVFHTDDCESEIKRLKEMGINVMETELVGDLKDYWLPEEYTHGLLINYAMEAAGTWFLAQGMHKASIAPEKLPKTGFIIRFGHVAHAVKNLDEALQAYEKLFRLKAYNRWEFPDAGINGAFVRIGSSGIQLVQPTDTKGIIAETMEEIGEGIAYAVLITNNLKAFVESMKAKGLEIPESTVGDKRVAWVPRKYTFGILYQIIEPGDYFSYFTHGKLYE